MAMLPFIAAAQLPDYVPTEGLEFWSAFDGNATDESIHSISATVQGALPTTDRNGLAQAALTFDGDDDFVLLYGAEGGIAFAEGLTLSAWIKPASSSGGTHPRIFNSTEGLGGGVDRWLFTWSPPLFGERMQFHVEPSSADGPYSSTPLNTGEWAHIAMTFEQGTVQFYLNGEVDGLANVSTTSLSHVLAAIQVGSANGNSFFHGDIDDIGIWNRPLTASEIQALFASVEVELPEYVPTDGLVAWYPFNGMAADESGYGNSVEVFGATLTEDRFGNPNGAYFFDGDDHMISPHQTWLNGGTGSRTFSGWFRQTEVVDYAHMITKGQFPLDDKLYLRIYSDGYTFSENSEFDNLAANGVSCPSPLDTSWNHLVGIKDTAEGTMSIYFNGVFMCSDAIDSPEYSPDNEAPLTLGVASADIPLPSGPQYFVGDLDELGIWNRALTEQEIIQLYDASSLTLGCTDSIACNYDATAEVDDGSCVYPPSVHLGDDLFTCDSSVVLAATVGSSYLWNTGDTSQTIQVFDSGVYTVEVAEEVDIENEESISFLEGIEDRVVIPHIAEYDVMTSGYSIALDIKLNSFETTNSGISDYIVHKLDESFGVGVNAMGFDIAISGGLPIVHFRLHDRLQSNLNYLVAIPQDSMALGEWHHMAFTIDESATKAYLNGEEVDAIETPSGFNIGNGSDPIVLGQPLEGASGFISEFNGNIDNLQLFSRALDPLEVASVASCPGNQMNSVDLLGYWNMENGQDGAISDLSEFGNGAQVMNAFLTSDTPSRSCSSYCAASDSVQVTILPCDNLTFLCGEGTVWDSTLQECVGVVSPADSILVPIPSCGEGTIWDPVNEECIIAIPADLNYDGCVTVNDLLVLLTVHGTCPPLPEWPDEPADTTWTCGDPLTYWDYDYATVLIGDQCWFAENLRTNRLQNGSFIPNVQAESDWIIQNSPALCFYDNDSSLAEIHGNLYNWYATTNEEGLCPEGWHSPDQTEWQVLIAFASDNTSISNAAKSLRSPEWCTGLNEFDFSALGSGNRRSSGEFEFIDSKARFWGTTISGFNPGIAFIQTLDCGNYTGAYFDIFRQGNPVRCIKD